MSSSTASNAENHPSSSNSTAAAGGTTIPSPAIPDLELRKQIWDNFVDAHWKAVGTTCGPLEVAVPDQVPLKFFLIGEDKQGIVKVNELIKRYLTVAFVPRANGQSARLVVGFSATEDKHAVLQRPDKIIKLTELFILITTWASGICAARPMPLAKLIEFDLLVNEGKKALIDHRPYRLWMEEQGRAQEVLEAILEQAFEREQ